MKGTDPVSAGLSLVGLGLGAKANADASKAQRRAQRGQDAVIQRMVDLYDTLMGKVKETEAQGGFNPDYYINQAEKDAARTEGRDLQNVAGAYRTLGYRPGDSAPQDALRGVRSRNLEALDTLRANLRRQAFMDRIAAYGSVGTGSLAQAGGMYGQQFNQAQGRMQNPAGMLASIMPYLTPQPNRNASTPGGGRTPTQQGSGGFKIPVNY